MVAGVLGSYVRTGSVLAVSFNKHLNFRIGHCNGQIRRMQQQTSY